MLASLAVAAGGVAFGLAVGDEAHHVSGSADKAFAAVLRGEILAHRTLLLTTTPRRYSRLGGDVAVIGMDDAAFGPRVFEFSLDDAVAAGVVADYRIVVAAVEAGCSRRFRNARSSPASTRTCLSNVRTESALQRRTIWAKDRRWENNEQLSVADYRLSAQHSSPVAKSVRPTNVTHS